MGMGKRVQGGPKTTWFDMKFDLDSKDKSGALLTWNGVTQSEDEYGYVFGDLQDVRVKEIVFGRKDNPSAKKGYAVTVTLRDRDSGERVIVSSGAGSRATCRLLGQLNVADLSRPLYIAPYVMEAGTTIKDEAGQDKVVEQATPMTAVRYVLGKNGDELELSDGIRAFYNDEYGSRMPSPVPVVVNGKPLMQNGQQVMDRSKLEELTVELVQTLQARIAALKDGHGEHNGHGDHGVNPEEAAAAAHAADRNAMRARAA